MTQLSSSTLARLDRFGTIVVTGPDARTFLQGQLTFDLERLVPERLELACCNSPQGRVQSVVWLIERSDGIVLVLPTTMVESTLARLKKYVLRAKVKLESGADRFCVFTATSAHADMPERAHVEEGEMSFVTWPGIVPRVLALGPASTAVTDARHDAAWHQTDVASGLPQVYPQTHEAFVAQMLNLDVLGGISFEKGCYTGQEIIARTHFRGAIKRRMFRFRASCAPPEPGTRLTAGEQHAGEVVDAIETASGCELLAVVSLAQIDRELLLEGVPGTLERLPLPYQV